MAEEKDKKGGPLSGSGWKANAVEAGIRDVYCDSWVSFANFITAQLGRFNQYIFRGQASEHWKLLPTLDRLVNINDLDKLDRLHSKHLESFKYAARGRRGSNPVSITTDEEWWALGQHFGLATPLLDWTEAPFVAAFFAFSLEENVKSENVVVYGLHKHNVKTRSGKLAKALGPNTEHVFMPVKVVTPLVEDNARLINQRGLFSWGPAGICMYDWVKENFSEKTDGATLLRIYIPKKDRKVALRTLNRMNVNHLSLFPDLSGASKFCNYDLMIPAY